jgi:23S rRNA (guanine2445-N2)-methyltransferase / 23S rRNA (guanine2069-N7)-methyltransferase
MNRLTTDGTLYFSNNYRGFEMDEEILRYLWRTTRPFIIA